MILAASCGIVVFNSTGQCIQANEAAAKITGGTIQQLLTQNFRQLKSWEETGMRRMADEVLASGCSQTGEFHSRSSFGRSFWLSGQLSRFDRCGEPHLLLIADEISARKQAEELAARHAAIIESSDDAIISKTLNGIITTWNPGAEKMFGFSAREAIGQPIQIIIPADIRDEESGILGRIKLEMRIRQFETVRMRKDGARICVSATITPIIGPGGDVIGVAKIVREITERKSLEAQFRQAQKMEAIGRLAGGVAHDFNNLLTLISGYCELSLSEIPADQPVGKYLTEMKKAGERAAALTRQLLAFARKQILVPDIIDLNIVVKDCETMLRRLLGEDVDLKSILAPNLGQVGVDGHQLEQALINLAINARDAMPQGGKLTIETVNVTLDETYSRTHQEVKPGRYVMLAVSDTGSGMDELTQSHIFEPFFTTKEPGRGTGLGLAMVFGFIKQSGGHISVYSELGLGTTFKIYLPQTTPEIVEASSPVDATHTDGCETILLVEDEPELRKLAKRILSQHGYNVLAAADGREALRLAELYANPIDLLVTDVVMPVMGGRELARQISALRPAIKVLFMSGYTDDAVMRHGVLSAETAFLQKPFTVEGLLAKVRKVLEQ